jgi:uncharacterized protein (TIGR03083 family)
MEYARYLDLIRSDSDLLLASALSRPESAVPSCPGWTNRDVVLHVGEVYEHKILCMELGRSPERGERASLPGPEADLAAWFTSLRDTLLTQLAARGPEQKSFTWFPPDQTVGFWFRRMAHETAVHRVDAELASGRVSPIAKDLAADGVDEFLGFLTFDETRPVRPEGADRTVALRCDGREWAVRMLEDRVERAPGGAESDGTIEGDPGDLLLHLWGRLPAGARSLSSSGDGTVLAAFRARLDEETD